MKTKVRVRIDVLLKAVVKKRDSLEAKHAKEVEKYEQEVVVYQETVAAALQKLADKIFAGRMSKTAFQDLLEHSWSKKHGYFVRVEVPGKGPQKPEQVERQLRDLDKLITTLKMASEDSILISAEDASIYL